MSENIRHLIPCPCGFRPPRTDDLEAWQSWYEHLETHKEADDE